MNAFNTAVFGFYGREKILDNLEHGGYIKILARFTHSDRLEPRDISINDLCFDIKTKHETEFDIPVDLFRKFQEKTFMLFLANMGRFDSYIGGHTDYAAAIYLFRRLTSFIYNLYLKQEIQLLLVSHTPHEIVDMLCEQLAHLLGIKVMVLVTPSYQKNGFFYMEDSRDYGRFKGKPLQVPLVPRSVDSFMQNSNTGDKSNAWVTYCNNWSHALLERQIIKGRYPQGNFRAHLEYRDNLADVSHAAVELPDNFIYFPLHYQPESSTIAQSDLVWDDQVTCIEYLAQKLPDSYAIVLKEQPAQSFYYRNQTFFNRLGELPQVCFVPGNTNSHDLIKKSRCVATITGTAGWEALKFGKPVIYFGYATYRDMPGAFAFTPDLSIEDVLRYQPQKEEIELSMGEFLATLYPGSIGEEPCENEEANWEICTASMKKIFADILANDTGYMALHAESMRNLQAVSRRRAWRPPNGWQPFSYRPHIRVKYPLWRRVIIQLLRLSRGADRMLIKLFLSK